MARRAQRLADQLDEWAGNYRYRAFGSEWQWTPAQERDAAEARCYSLEHAAYAAQELADYLGAIR
jgi:hypothetical protein